MPGSGQGVQGRANGEESRLAGTGAPDDPFRTIGDHGHEGAGIWARGVANNIVDNVVANAAFGSVLWSRFQPTEQIPAFPGADPNVDYQIVNRGLQHDHEFRGNEFYGMAVAASWQGIEQFGGTFVVEDGNVWNVWTNLDTSYSGTIRFDGGQYRGRFSFVQTGFTGHLEAVGGVQIIGFRTGLVLTHGGKVDDAYFACTQIDVLIEYEKTSTDQNQIVIDNARFSDDSSNIVYRLGDWFNKRSYTAPLDVLVHDYNGVEGDDFQIWMPQQQANYVMPITSNSNRGNRMSPEEGLTNQQLWNKYKLALGGKVLPKDAVSRAGIGGYVTAIPADLEGPQILDLKVTVSGSRAVLTFVTDEPCYSQVEYAAGDITVEGYAKFLSASKKLTTSHRVTITGLKANTDYQFLVRVIDVKGNLGGDTRLGGLKYVTREFDT
ncbi:MAG: fibronectin type III domain-containing protein [Pirellulales bacterium]|nr:fibronectin type III domain-containing protein [Pirellulales bacterium]